MWKPGDYAKLVDGTLCQIVRLYKNGNARVLPTHTLVRAARRQRVVPLWQVVPLSTQRTIQKDECTHVKMVAGNEQRFTRVIIGHDVQMWVGFGWIVERPATEEDYAQYAVVVA